MVSVAGGEEAVEAEGSADEVGSVGVTVGVAAEDTRALGRLLLLLPVNLVSQSF